MLRFIAPLLVVSIGLSSCCPHVVPCSPAVELEANYLNDTSLLSVYYVEEQDTIYKDWRMSWLEEDEALPLYLNPEYSVSTFLLLSSNSIDTLLVKPEFEVRYDDCGTLWLAIKKADVQVSRFNGLNYYLINACNLKVELNR